MSEKSYHQKRFDALKTESQTWLSTWKDIAQYIKPTRGYFNNQPNKGTAIDHQTILDCSPMLASRTLASGMMSGLTSPSRPWFRLGLPDSDLMKYEPVKVWLDDVRDRMMQIYSKSNIYGVLYSIYDELGPFGTSAALLVEDFHEIIRGRHYTVGEYYLATDHNCRVNTFARTYAMKVGQLVSEFGEENVGEKVRKLYLNKEYDQWINVYHLIDPNLKRENGRSDNKNMAFSSKQWVEGAQDGEFLRESGYEEFPVLAPRWDTTTSADAYGKGPGWEALGDAKMIQKMQKDKLIALDKLIDPPVQADSSLQGEVNTLPGGVTRFSNSLPNAGLKPAYQVNPDLQAIEFSISKTEEKIRQVFYSDLFLMLAQSDRTQMTAREVVERHEEKLLMLGPVLERLENELLDPLIERSFSIANRLGLIPPPPEEIQGADLRVEYISLLAQAQKMVGTTAIEQAVGFVGNMAAAFPDALDNIDADEVVRQYAEMLGVPPKMVRGADAVAQIRKGKQQQMAQMQQMANAQAMVQGAKTLSETSTDGNNALTALVGMRK